MVRPANTAAQRESTLQGIVACRRMWNLQGAVLAFTVTYFLPSVNCILVTAITEERLATAIEQCDGAAEHALPIDEVCTMDVADVSPDTHLLHQAWSTDEIFAPRRVFHDHLLLAIDQTAKVGLVTTSAHVEAHGVLGKLHQLVVIEVTFRGHSWIFVHALFSCDCHGLHLQV